MDILIDQPFLSVLQISTNLLLMWGVFQFRLTTVLNSLICSRWH